MTGPRQLNKLLPIAVSRLKKKKRGRLRDGGGLLCEGTPRGVYFTLRYTRSGKQHDLGLGYISLALARKLAADARTLLAQGVDPVEAKRRAAPPPALPPGKTFRQCADELIATLRPGWRSEKHASQWVASLGAPCARIGDMSIADIDTPDILAVLRSIWLRTPESAKRLQNRIELVFDFSKAHALRSGDNPARWRGHLAMLLPRQPVSRRHHAAMPYAEIPAFLQRLRERNTVASCVLTVIIYTCLRLNEGLGARWEEIEGDVWTVPASRMKGGVAHRIPLSPPTLDILQACMPYNKKSGFIFPGRDNPAHRHFSAKPVQVLMTGGYTVHGFRSAFRDWAGDRTSVPREIAEACLAHKIGSKSSRLIAAATPWKDAANS
jgi:integrase